MKSLGFGPRGCKLIDDIQAAREYLLSMGFEKQIQHGKIRYALDDIRCRFRRGSFIIYRLVDNQPVSMRRINDGPVSQIMRVVECFIHKKPSFTISQHAIDMFRKRIDPDKNKSKNNESIMSKILDRMKGIEHVEGDKYYASGIVFVLRNNIVCTLYPPKNGSC